MRKKKISSGQAPAAAGDNVVRISTIHKSKGLEYPFVIVGGLGHRFRKDSNEKSLSFDSSIGVGLPYIDPARKYWRSTPVQRAINAKSLRDGYREELRILYVAMTRARNKLILTGTCESEEKVREYTADPDCYLKVMRDVLNTGYNTYHVRPLSSAACENNVRAVHVPDPGSIILDDAEKEMYAEIDRRFGYEYPDSDQLTAKAKYSVSELRRMDTTADSRDKAVRPRRRSTRAGASEIGTGYHRIMEHLDFSLVTDAYGNVDTGYIEECAGFLRENGAVEEAVFSEIDTGRIGDFFRTDLGRRAAAAARRGALMKEKPFTLRTDAPGDNSRSVKTVLVQGVIDCCFEENGSMVLVDYKSGYIRPGDGHEQELDRIRKEYRLQIELYSEAVRKGKGLPVSEAYLYLFTSGESLRMD